MTAPPPQTRRPLLVVFHFGIYFLVFTQFLIWLGNAEVIEQLEAISPHYIRNHVILLSFGFVGYLGLWNMRRFSIPWLALAGILLMAYAHRLGSSNFLLGAMPLLAGLTCVPLWPSMKTP